MWERDLTKDNSRDNFKQSFSLTQKFSLTSLLLTKTRCWPIASSVGYVPCSNTNKRKNFTEHADRVCRIFNIGRILRKAPNS